MHWRLNPNVTVTVTSHDPGRVLSHRAARWLPLGVHRASRMAVNALSKERSMEGVWVTEQPASCPLVDAHWYCKTSFKADRIIVHWFYWCTIWYLADFLLKTLTFLAITEMRWWLVGMGSNDATTSLRQRTRYHSNSTANLHHLVHSSPWFSSRPGWTFLSHRVLCLVTVACHFLYCSSYWKSIIFWPLYLWFSFPFIDGKLT